MGTMSPLRRRMIEDMTVRNLSPATQLNAVSKFSRYFGRSPDRLGLDEVHAFQVYLVANGISWPALNQAEPLAARNPGRPSARRSTQVGLNSSFFTDDKSVRFKSAPKEIFSSSTSPLCPGIC